MYVQILAHCLIHKTQNVLTCQHPQHAIIKPILPAKKNLWLSIFGRKSPSLYFTIYSPGRTLSSSSKKVLLWTVSKFLFLLLVNSNKLYKYVQQNLPKNLPKKIKASNQSNPSPSTWHFLEYLEVCIVSWHFLSCSQNISTINTIITTAI